jgi:hypothetical protein
MRGKRSWSKRRNLRLSLHPVTHLIITLTFWQCREVQTPRLPSIRPGANHRVRGTTFLTGTSGTTAEAENEAKASSDNRITGASDPGQTSSTGQTYANQGAHAEQVNRCHGVESSDFDDRDKEGAPWSNPTACGKTARWR